MAVFVIYAALLTWLIYKNRVFGLFSDPNISTKFLLVLFFLKLLAVPAFYLFFKISYGGIEKLDAGKFYHDSVVMNELAYTNFGEYFKMLFGMQDDSQGSFFFKNCIDTTYNWDNGPVKDFFYNDNRVVIRIHSVLHFIAFNSYFAHALFDCFASFIGLFLIYKTLKHWFTGKEKHLLVTLMLFPTLWLYTGGLLKEGITILFFGWLLFCLQKFICVRPGLWIGLQLLFLLFLALLLKPYFLFYGAAVFTLLFIIECKKIKHGYLFFFGTMLLLVLLGNLASILVKHRTLLQAAEKRELEFRDLSTGGIFLLDSVKFVRVPYDTNLVERVKSKPNFYTIKPGVSFTYWEHSHQQDTLYCSSNVDASATYSLVYILPKAGSAINVIEGSPNYFVSAMRSLYYTTLHPFFFNAKGIMQQFASLENLILLISFLITAIGLFLKKKTLPGFIFAFFGLSLFILVGFTTPNSGAIVRYRAPAAVFVLVSALYFLDAGKLKSCKI